MPTIANLTYSSTMAAAVGGGGDLRSRLLLEVSGGPVGPLNARAPSHHIVCMLRTPKEQH